MKTSDFSFQLPPELIATHPTEKRSDSRLLSLSRADGKIDHETFTSMATLLQPNDLLVFNDTRVIPARLYGAKESGGRIEVLIERIVSEREVIVQLKSSKSPKAGSTLYFGEADDRSSAVEVVGRIDEFFVLRLGDDVADLMERFGHVPLPPYIDRADELSDRERYQTIYGKNPGAAAAPTAGLHFDQQLMNALREQGVDFGFLTLHVGAGTFQPVRVEDVEAHKMHKEWIEIGDELCERVERCKAKGGRVVAVGTTCVRSLESAANSGVLKPTRGETDIFIYPGYEFKIVDAMITNFHLPESTLLMLVSAFAGKQAIQHAYETAVAERYRFFSYGDAMFIS